MSSSVSSSNSSVAGTSQIYSYSNSGLSGLVSGMDTETMVKKMLQGTQTKIDTQKQKQQVLTWKQTMYRSVISKINTLKSKYFDTSYGSSLTSNLSSSKFFNSKIAKVSSGSSVTVASADSSAYVGDMTFKVSQLATAAKLSSPIKMSGSQGVTGTAINYSKLKAQISSGDVTFDLSLDGITKTITLTSSDFLGDTISASDLSTVLNTKVSKAFGDYISTSITDDKLAFGINILKSDGTVESGHQLTVTGASATYLGITPGASSFLSSSATLGSLSGVSGSTYGFSINGTDFIFSADDTIGTMINTINKSDAGVTMSYSAATDNFTLQASSTGAKYAINVSQTSGNLLTVLFGESNISAASAVGGRSLNTGGVVGTGLASDYKTTGASLAMKVNGKSYTFSLDTKTSGTYSKSEVETALNDWLKDKFGTQADGSTQNISYANGTFTTADGYHLSFDKTGVKSTDSTASSSLAVAMGLAENGASNAVTGTTKLSEVPGLSELLNAGVLYDTDGNAVTGDTTLAGISTIKDGDNTYNISFNSTEGSLILSGGSGDVTFANTALKNYFGGAYSFGTGNTEKNVGTVGKDLKITINDIVTSRSSNTFTVDGLTVTATKVDTSDSSSTVTTTLDADSVVTAIKSFVSDYNALVSDLYGTITQDYTYKDYKPLTDAQKEEMSDSAITAWEKKAQTGLLRNDSTISTFLQEMRNAFYTKVASAGIAAYSIGIETTQNDLSGKLTLDESALRSAIASDPDAVAKLFTDSTSGLSTMLAKAMDNAAKLSAASPGSLVLLAGADGWTTNAKTNDIYKELLSINDKLSELQDKYDSEKQRYWNKFNNMETVIARYQSQSSQISSSFSS